MSQEALDYWQGSDAVKALPAAAKFLLRQIAMLHDPRVNCAYVKVDYLAGITQNSPRNCRRLLASLEKKGLLVRHSIERPNGSQTANEYELPGMRVSTAVTEQVRQQVFKTPRNRKAAQLTLSLMREDATEPTEANGVHQSPAVAETNQSNRGHAPGCAAVVDEPKDCGYSQGFVRPPPDNCCPPPPGQQLSALDVVLDVVLDVLPPPSPAFIVEKCKSADQSEKQRTTARAKAKATTPVMRSAEASMERGGGSGMSSGRVIPFRGRRDPEIIRAGLDGFEAALFDETMRVLGECGMGPKSVTRCMRNAVEDALRARMESEQCSLADAGSYLTEQWDLYVECRHSLTNLVGARRFFAEGYWLDDRRWDWSLAAKEHLSRLGAARTGMR